MVRIPVGTVKSRLHRARRVLQTRLAHLMPRRGVS
jgi:DNA-directed RNA polymerase specialized sigma24 family protein